MTTDASLRKKATDSTSLAWDPVVWSQLAMAEVKVKLMEPWEYERLKKIVKYLKKHDC